MPSKYQRKMFLCCPYKNQHKRKKGSTRRSKTFLESGNYLSSQRLTVSTFGVKELNFCVRNGNRWILFAIITAMVIYLCVSTVHILFCFSQKTNNYIAKLCTFSFLSSYHFLSCVLVKIIDFLSKRFS